MTNRTDDFLAHYGIPGMKWGKRKASSSKGNSIEDHINRSDREKKLKRLIDEDVNPKRTVAKDFTSGLLKQHKEVLISGLATTGSVALGTAFMTYRLNKSFRGISMSPIPFG